MSFGGSMRVLVSLVTHRWRYHSERVNDRATINRKSERNGEKYYLNNDKILLFVSFYFIILCVDGRHLTLLHLVVVAQEEEEGQKKEKLPINFHLEFVTFVNCYCDSLSSKMETKTKLKEFPIVPLNSSCHTIPSDSRQITTEQQVQRGRVAIVVDSLKGGKH